MKKNDCMSLMFYFTGQVAGVQDHVREIVIGKGKRGAGIDQEVVIENTERGAERGKEAADITRRESEKEVTVVSVVEKVTEIVETVNVKENTEVVVIEHFKRK